MLSRSSTYKIPDYSSYTQSELGNSTARRGKGALHQQRAILIIDGYLSSIKIN